MAFQSNDDKDTRDRILKNLGSIGANRKKSPGNYLTDFLGRNGKRVIRVFALIGILVSVYFLVGGVVCLVNNSTAKDADGYYRTWNVNVKRDSFALVFMPKSSWIISGDMGNLKLYVSNNDPARQVFIGSATADKVTEYLGSVQYDNVTRFHLFPVYISSEAVGKSTTVSAPGAQSIWTQSVSGSGPHMLEWATKSNTAVVVMNADGSAGLNLHATIWTVNAYNFLAGMANLLIGLFLILLSLFTYLYTKKPATSTYPPPLETLYEEKMAKQKRKGKGLFGK